MRFLRSSLSRAEQQNTDNGNDDLPAYNRDLPIRQRDRAIAGNVNIEMRYEQDSFEGVQPGMEALPPSYTATSISGPLQIHPIPSKNAVLVKVQPPRLPKAHVEHIPCDIVLVIDVSGSMDDAAPVPGSGTDEQEDTGLSVLDLVKHATNTIIHNCSDRDRLGIVKFASHAAVVQELVIMSPENKQRVLRKVKNLQPASATNLWGGITKGLSLFSSPDHRGNVPAMMVLTDGMPNHMCPQQGYVPKLDNYRPLPASIHTFGFGYNLRSGLLKSIAEAGGGNYGFIPDAGMIGTVFNHAVANLQSTYATNAVLRLRYDESLDIEETMGDHVDQAEPDAELGRPTELTIKLGNLQFAQTRDIFLNVRGLKKHSHAISLPDETVLSAEIAFTTSLDNVHRTQSTTGNLLGASPLAAAEIAYHESRALICSFLLRMFPSDEVFERRYRGSNLPSDYTDPKALFDALPARAWAYADPDCKSLVEDVWGDEPHGQIRTALSNPTFMTRWGCHYFLSYVNAHTRQICNSFKDPGPQRYGADSPMFQRCLRNLDREFDNLPPPKPSRAVIDRKTGLWRNFSSASVQISHYNNAMGSCFAGSTKVTLASGRKIAIRKLRRGMQVKTPAGSRKVAVLLKTPVVEERLCSLGSLLVTPWHPISADGKSWDLPADIADGSVLYTGSVYSVMLQRDSQSAAHALSLEGWWGVTLGHGITSGDNDVRAHQFFGDWARVGKNLMQVGVSNTGISICGGADRDADTGMVCGFRGATQE